MSVEKIARTGAGGGQDILENLLHYELFSVAERVRWRMEDIPWSSLAHQHVSPHLRGLVRQIALAELTTYAATRRFLQEFSTDIDFTQWMSVWFYEETKHPHALIRWLSEVGEPFSHAEMTRGRVTAPFMKSHFGMLVTNVISEVHASATYLALARTTEEPVLRKLSINLAGDEARHATGFLAYARRALERSSKPSEDRLEALKVLHMWINENSNVQHPVNTVRLRTSGEGELLGGLAEATEGDASAERHSKLQRQIARRRALYLVSNLIGIPIKTPEDVLARIRELSRPAGASGLVRSEASSPAQNENER